MNDELISVIDAAEENGLYKQTIFKVIKRLGISTVKRRSTKHRNQLISYIKKSDLVLILQDLWGGLENTDDAESQYSFQVDQGIFYLIQLEPNHDPGRFKVGFASNITERFRTHRCSAPFAEILETWSCHKLWEKTAIDCVTQNCERIHTEVFRTDNIAQVKEMCDRFFSLMPPLNKVDDEHKKTEE